MRKKSLNQLFSWIAFGLMMMSMTGCGSEGKTIEITPAEIDEYVTEKLGENQLYDVSQSLRFSKETETYEVVEYVQDDSAVLHMETHVTDDEQITRQFFYLQGVPVYIDEMVSSNVTDLPFIQRRIYLDGVNVLRAEERSSAYENELAYLEYDEVTVDIDQYDIERPKRAMLQQGEFQMSFEEFISIPPQEYLILENKESKYDVALFIAEGDDHAFLTDLRENEDAYKGRPVFITHQFIIMQNIERMLFIDGYFTDEDTNEEQSEPTDAE